MHPVGGRRSVEDVIVAEDFTFAAASAMADDVTGLRFSTRDAVDALTFVSPDSLGTACPLSGRNSTYRPVQILEAGSSCRYPPTHSVVSRERAARAILWVSS